MLCDCCLNAVLKHMSALSKGILTLLFSTKLVGHGFIAVDLLFIPVISASLYQPCTLSEQLYVITQHFYSFVFKKKRVFVFEECRIWSHLYMK